MTRKEFEKIRLTIEGEKFQQDFSDPVTYGIQRAAFEREKFRKLIAAAQQVNMQTARTKMAQWQRQLARATESQERFEKLRQDITAATPLPRETRARGSSAPMRALNSARA